MKDKKEYRSLLDQHLREEKKYLSSLHLREIQDNDIDATIVLEQNINLHDDTIEVADTFVDRYENKYNTRCWTLSSGTDVSEILAKYIKTVPEEQKCLNPVYWGILDLTGDHLETKALFSSEDWSEMVDNFEQEVKLSQAKISDAVYHFFDEVHQIVLKNNHNPIMKIMMEIDMFFPEEIEKKYGITLSTEEKHNISVLKHVIVTYIENLKDIDLPVSESEFGNSFPNMLMRKLLDHKEVKIDVGEVCWELCARVGRRCDFRGILKHSIDNLEAIVGLRSEKEIDNVQKPEIDDILHQTFVLGVHSWGWTHDVYGMDCKATNICRLGRLYRTKMPNNIRTIACLEEFYTIMLDVKTTLKDICEHVNGIALSHARVYRNRKRKNQ
ncbi:hypothetical protein C1645_838154 [Glomus cerebriforme]|uniref:Uncharacterized protein n=1 Tax=Glomus cerebriforme TaxID=658196 RepID=A0A397S9R8_9GLOM|nr:hypothetical protein C1645_838154 [Glomus cerebriforme]